MRFQALAGSIVPMVALMTLTPSSGRTALEAPAIAHEAYVPGLGDFMTGYVQPHHIKLWFAGMGGKWELASYEADELDETFDDVVTYQPRWHALPIDKLVRTLIRPSIKRVNAAIASKDISQFERAYVELNAACNTCHRAAKHSFIEIVVPAYNPYADQDSGQLPPQATATPETVVPPASASAP